jgi:hypothetical protein
LLLVGSSLGAFQPIRAQPFEYVYHAAGRAVNQVSGNDDAMCDRLLPVGAWIVVGTLLSPASDRTVLARESRRMVVLSRRAWVKEGA